MLMIQVIRDEMAPRRLENHLYGVMVRTKLKRGRLEGVRYGERIVRVLRFIASLAWEPAVSFVLTNGVTHQARNARLVSACPKIN